MKILSIVSIACLLLATSCGSNTVRSKRTWAAAPKNIIKDVRTDTSSEWSHFVSVRTLNSFIDLDPPEHGFDSMQIRIWYSHSLGIYKRLLLLEFADEEWHAKLYDLTTDMSNSSPYLVVEGARVQAIAPKGSWDKLFTALQALDIQSLPGDSDSGTDGGSYSVEIATNNRYVYYDYWEPRGKNSPHAAKMLRIVSLLEQTFNFEFTDDD